MMNNVTNVDIRLRNAKISDIDDLFKWRNDPVVRKNFFNTNPVSWDEHKKWFEVKSQDADTTIYMAHYGENKIGSIRFENKSEAIKLSVMLNPDFLGKGLGAEVIRLAAKKFMSEKETRKPLIAEIKKDNITSIKAFQKAGFKESYLTFVCTVHE